MANVPLSVTTTADRAETNDSKPLKQRGTLRSIAVAFSGDSTANPIRKGELYVSATVFAPGRMPLAGAEGYMTRALRPQTLNIDLELEGTEELFLKAWCTRAMKVTALYRIEDR